ncbi:MAG: sulfur carrier protein ThiS [Actinobacteria bacterium]|nr:sulfur carrier protein ThiS [Actinomycetota bacterium]
MRVMLNGLAAELADDATVAELVARHAASPKGVAVAVNAEVVPKSAWPQHHLADGDRVEMLKAAQGG